jgi:DNA-binding MarR family transcriptional regulator
MATDPDDESSVLDRLHESIYRYGMAERQLITRYKRASGSLSPGRLRALNVLLRTDEATPGDLAREAGLRPNSITTMLDQLERSGAISRRRDDADRRVSWISLTDAGRRELADLQRDWERAFAGAFDGLSDGELAAASMVMDRVAEVFLAFDVPDT